MIAHQTGKVRSGDVNIFYRKLGERGNKTPMLIVHGLSFFSYDWLEVAQALATDREVLCMDMRGFGDSEWSRERDYSVPTMGQDVVTVLDHLRWKKAVVIGHSMGGRSTTYAAAKHPARVAGLALIDYTPENAPAGSKRVSHMVANVPTRFAALQDALKYFGSTDRARFEAYLKPVEGGFVIKRDAYFQNQFKSGQKPVLGADMWQLLGELHCPVLSMRGTRSDLYAAETKEKMQAANSRVKIVEVDAGHHIAGDNPQGFLAALREWETRNL
jgi:pimeloyl-ACP methyl ester carboxylesterase